MIFPSLACCDPGKRVNYLRAFEQAHVEAIHFDVTDGHYSPTICLGVDDFKDVRRHTSLPIDLHLAVQNPEQCIDFFPLCQGDRCSFHPEVCNQPYQTLQRLAKRGVHAGLAISPGVPIDYLRECFGVLDFVLVMAVNPGFAGQKIVPNHFEKLARVVRLAWESELPMEVIVDGNTTAEHAARMVGIGASGLVVGSSSLIHGSPSRFLKKYPEYFARVSGTVSAK